MYILTGHEDFLKDLIDGFPFVVVCGDSGTGKTTLVSKVLGDIASESVGIVILKEGLHTKKVIMEKLSLRAVENKLLRHDSVIFFIEKIDSIMPVLRPLVEANIAGMPKECAVVATLSTEFEKCQWDFVKNKAMLCYLNLDDVISPFMWEQVKLYIGKQDRARQDSIHKSIQELRGSLGVRGLFKLLRLSEMNSLKNIE